MDVLYHLYGFPSFSKFKLRLKKDKKKYTDEQIRNFLKKQVPEQIMKRTKKPKAFNTIQSNDVSGSLQMDLMVYNRYKMNGYSYIFMCIDVYSRYLYAKALTNRRMDTLMQNIYKAFELFGVPDNINCDNEFNKKEVNKMASDLGIKMWFSEPEEINKNAIVERCNRTIAEMIEKWRIGTGRKDWYKVLDNIVYNYNHQYHKTIKGTPYDVFKHRTVNKQKIIKTKPNIKVGDTVRVQAKKTVFQKGDRPKYSKEVYKVNKTQGRRYALNDGKKTYKEYELMKVLAEPTVKKTVRRTVRKKNTPVGLAPTRARRVIKKKTVLDYDDL